jgi:hypothetical protein
MTIHTLSPQGLRLTISADQESMKYENEESKDQTPMQTKALVSLMKGSTSLVNGYNTNYRVPIWWTR